MPTSSEGSRAEKDLHSRHLAARLTRWGAAWSFFDEGDPAAETWVADKATAVLEGRARAVAAGIQRQATRHGLDPPRRINADRAATYLTNKADHLDYPTALASGWPIATGVIEGACRHLVKGRMDLTGARSGLDGAEAILKLRALRANGDFDNYWSLCRVQHRLHPGSPSNRTWCSILCGVAEMAVGSASYSVPSASRCMVMR